MDTNRIFAEANIELSRRAMMRAVSEQLRVLDPEIEAIDEENRRALDDARAAAAADDGSGFWHLRHILELAQQGRKAVILNTDEKSELIGLIDQLKQQVLAENIANYFAIRVRFTQLLDRWTHSSGTVYANHPDRQGGQHLKDPVKTFMNANHALQSSEKMMRQHVGASARTRKPLTAGSHANGPEPMPRGFSVPGWKGKRK